MYQRNTYDYIPRKRKVKHVKLLKERFINALEDAINKFADDHPEYKVLGIRIQPMQGGSEFGTSYLACVTYLEDAKDDILEVEDDYGTDEEGDID